MSLLKLGPNLSIINSFNDISFPELSLFSPLFFSNICFNLFAFIKEYLENALIDYGSLKVNVINKEHAVYNIKFSPQDIIIIIDNVISNSSKQEHHAKQLEVRMSKQDNGALIIFEDDGMGLNKAVQNIDDIFEQKIEYIKKRG